MELTEKERKKLEKHRRMMAPRVFWDGMLYTLLLVFTIAFRDEFATTPLLNVLSIAAMVIWCTAAPLTVVMRILDNRLVSRVIDHALKGEE